MRVPFVDTPEAKGTGNEKDKRIARLERQRRALRVYLDISCVLIVVLVVALIFALMPQPADAADYTTAHPARPGYSRVLVAPLPESEGVVVQGPDGSPVVLKDAKKAEESHTDKGRLALAVTAAVAWIAVLIRIF